MKIRSLLVVVMASAAIVASANPPIDKPFPSVGPIPKAPSCPASPAAVVMVLGAAFQAARKRLRK
jgi:hypothetical protein